MYLDYTVPNIAPLLSSLEHEAIGNIHWLYGNTAIMFLHSNHSTLIIKAAVLILLVISKIISHLNLAVFFL